MSQYFKVHPINPQLPAAEPCGGDRPRRRPRRVSDRLELRFRLAPRRQSGARARAPNCAASSAITTSRSRAAISSDIATYARVENWAYRLLKALTPGPYTFVLRATHAVAEAAARPETALDRHSGARSHDRSGAARRARRAAHELDAAACRTIRCRSRTPRTSAIGSSVTSTRSSTAAPAASSPRRFSISAAAK